ncbi:hypothetical protein AAMO2058_000819200 [Amorphochlora amoebiformis]
MGERKVTNKYYPPDFDPLIIPKRENWRAPGKQIKIRFMLPMSIQCQTCGEYMYRGKKFNARKEDMYGPDSDYLGIRKYRFYIRCVSCCAEVCMRTDPKNSDYVVERGASRNFEPWKQESELNKKIQELRAEKDEADTMTNLESRTKESKREMEVLDALQEIQDMNNRSAKVDTAAILEERARREQEAADKAIKDELEKVQDQFKGRVKRLESGSSDSEARRKRRAANSIFAKTKHKAEGSMEAGGVKETNEKTDTSPFVVPKVAVVKAKKKKKKKKRKAEERKSEKKKKKTKRNDSKGEDLPSGLGLVAAYGSSDSQ